MKALFRFGFILPLALLPAVSPSVEESPGTSAPTPVVPGVRGEVQPEIDRHLAAARDALRKELDKAEQVQALFKLPVSTRGLRDPWGGLADLENHGLRMAASARGELSRLPALLDDLGAAVGKPAGKGVPLPPDRLVTLEDHVAHILRVFDAAREQRDKALAGLSKEERTLLFEGAHSLLENFGPQVEFDGTSKAFLEQDRTYFSLMQTRCDWSLLAGSAQTLLALAEPGYLAGLRKVLDEATPIKDTVPGVTGDLLYKKETKHGLVLFGGKRANTYDLKVPVALLVDLGGDDTYRGTVASSFDADHPLSVVIDLAGNDTYEGAELGLATGRAGVGLLVDLAGDDTYKLAPGSGGVGMAGIGILCDVEGKDVYTGSRYTQGVGFAGIGLLLDLAGDDRYTSHGYALGFGGPGGVGAVLDVAGDDSYQCGHKIPSGYNESDSPSARPGDPAFQWDAFGMGMGMGRRIYPRSPEGNAYALAGGLGVVIDLAGNDRYDSSNFSQACGYFFGVGLKLDLAGDDTHGAARYGHAAGAHYGMGLFIDYAGNDTYTSAGPTYNGGCAWDHSVFLCIDAGAGDDTYRFERSAGLGIGDIGSWGVFTDLGGKDVYRAGNGLGRASRTGLGVFYDRSGQDDYAGVADGAPRKLGNARTLADPSGGLFIDR